MAPPLLQLPRRAEKALGEQGLYMCIATVCLAASCQDALALVLSPRLFSLGRLLAERSFQLILLLSSTTGWADRHHNGESAAASTARNVLAASWVQGAPVCPLPDLEQA